MDERVRQRVQTHLSGIGNVGGDGCCMRLRLVEGDNDLLFPAQRRGVGSGPTLSRDSTDRKRGVGAGLVGRPVLRSGLGVDRFGDRFVRRRGEVDRSSTMPCAKFCMPSDALVRADFQGNRSFDLRRLLWDDVDLLACTSVGQGCRRPQPGAHRRRSSAPSRIRRVLQGTPRMRRSRTHPPPPALRC